MSRLWYASPPGAQSRDAGSQGRSPKRSMRALIKSLHMNCMSRVGVPCDKTMVRFRDPPCRAIPGRCQPLEFQRPFGEKLTLMRPDFNSEPFHPGNPSRVLGSPRESTSEVPGILRSAGADPGPREMPRRRSVTSRNVSAPIRDLAEILGAGAVAKTVHEGLNQKLAHGLHVAGGDPL